MTPEVSTYLERIGQLRGEVWKMLEGLDAAGLDWTPLPEDTNSLFVLATHAIGSEHGWIAETLADEPHTRVRSKEFLARGKNMGELRERFEATAVETERILGRLTEDDLEQVREQERHGKITVRWIMLHVIEHYSLHLGQMQLTRQLFEAKG